MADIIEFPQEQVDSNAAEEENDDSFLLEEGLELLACFRAIKDSGVRKSILHLVRTLSNTAKDSRK